MGQTSSEEAESHYRAFFDNAAAGMVELDMKGRFLRANETFCRISSYSREELAGLTMAEITHPGDRERDLQAFNRFREGRSPAYEIEKRYLRKDGGISWIQVSAGMIRSAEGEPQRMAAVVRDITRQRRAEAALREREESFRAALEKAAVGIGYVRPADGRWLWINETFCRILGYASAEMASRKLKTLIVEEDVETIRSILDGLSRGEIDTETREIRMFHRDGLILWLRATFSAVRSVDRGSGYHVVIAEDITARKATEKALEVTESRLKLALEASQIGSWELDLGDRSFWRTERHDQIFGYEAIQPEWSYDTFLEHVVEEDRSEVDRTFREALAGKATWNIECRVSRADGAERWIWVRGKVHYDARSSRPLRVYGLIADITDRKLLEENLRVARREAEEANRAKSEFVANMSHEIRTPMTVFLSALEQLLEIDRSRERRPLLEMAEQSGRRLRRLIDDILDFSRIEARRMELEEKPFDLRACVQNALSMMSLPARQKGLELVSDISPGLPPLLSGDADRIEQVLINLLSNALKFTEAGEIKVSVHQRGERHIEFLVSDTGIGFPAEKRDLLFQSFSQMDSSFARRYGGTGLGLAICKGLVELMGGSIAAESRAGSGSTFRFVLPLAPAGEPGREPPVEKAPAEASLPEARILIVEDEPMIRDLLLLILSRRGWMAATAENGSQALQKWQTGSFDLVLMDLQMPEIDGMEATRKIRAAEEENGKPRTCIVGLTAHARPEVKEACLEIGMDQVLIKPVDTDELYGVIEHCIAG